MPFIRLLAAAAVLFAASLAAAQAPGSSPAAPAVTLGDWLARDRALAALPPGAERTAALEALHRDVLAGLAAARVDLAAREAAGAPRTACLPPPGTTELSSQEIGGWLHFRPASEHGEALREVLVRFLAARFPCR